MLAKSAAVLSLALVLGGCTTIRNTSPQRSVQEELAISTAADRAAEALARQMPPGMFAYLDTSGVAAQDAGYATAAIEDQLLRRGVRLTADRAKADAIVILRAGVLATYESGTLLGTPAFTPPFFSTFAVPEIALYKDAIKKGVAKFAATVYDPKTGKLIVSTGPAYGFSYSNDYVLLLLFSWNGNDTGVDLRKTPPRVKRAPSPRTLAVRSVLHVKRA